LLGAIVLFVVVLVVSFELLRGDDITGDKPTTLAGVELAGDETTVFSWRREACSPLDIPDLPSRAFRNATGRVQLVSTSYVNRGFVGSDLTKLEHPCNVLMGSARDPDPAAYADREWLASPYTDDGQTIYSLVHNEYQGNKHPGQCASGDYLKCWYNSVTLVVSRDGGRTYKHVAAPPAHRVASLPYVYEPDSGPSGYFSPSNIVLNTDDGYYYAMLRAEDFRAQPYGTCLMRTKTLADPGSWRAWGGSAFDIQFADPYTQPNLKPRDHVCIPVSPNQIGAMVESLTFNEYFDKWLLIGSSQDTIQGRNVVGFYYSLSDDLRNWSHRKLIREVEMNWSFKCGDPSPVGYPSVLDPGSDSRNFDTTGRTPYLFFTRFHHRNCQQNLDRDLVRVPIRFSK
jgi:hypothetical protein